jgi:hypothetical protein
MTAVTGFTCWSKGGPDSSSSKKASRIGSAAGLGTAATTSEKGLNLGALVKNPVKSSSLGMAPSLLQYIYLLRSHSRRHVLEKVFLLLLPVVKTTGMGLRGTVG